MLNIGIHHGNIKIQVETNKFLPFSIDFVLAMEFDFQYEIFQCSLCGFHLYSVFLGFRCSDGVGDQQMCVLWIFCGYCQMFECND